MNLNALKGMLIILVIIDHNEYSRSIFPGFLQGFAFHVVGFMTLPFLRPAMQWNRDILTYVFRQYYPFFLVCSLMALVVALVTPVGLDRQLQSWTLALYSGNSDVLKNTTHMALLWFLPSFISVILIRTAIENVGMRGKLISIGLLCLVHPFVGTVAQSVQNYLPMGLLPALYIVPLAYAGALLHNHVFARLTKSTAFLVSAAVLVIVKYLQIQANLYNEVGFALVADYTQPYALLLNDLEAVSGVLMLLQLARFDMPSIFTACGRYSLQIYLGHAFVALLLYKIMEKLALTANPEINFLVSLILTILLSLAIASGITGSGTIRRFVFPRSPAELFGLMGTATKFDNNIAAPLLPTQATGKKDVAK